MRRHAEKVANKKNKLRSISYLYECQVYEITEIDENDYFAFEWL